MILKFILFFSFLTSLAMAQGGGGFDRGNGGDIVSCQTTKDGTAYEVLDFFEAFQSRGLHFAKDLNSANAPQVLNKVFRRIQSQYPALALRYRELYSQFEKEMIFKDLPFADVTDEGFYELPANCRLLQGAVQFRDGSVHNRRFYIHEPLWKQLSAESQAGLILHELTYRMLLERNPGPRPISLDVRGFVGYFFSEEFQLYGEISLPDYLRI